MTFTGNEMTKDDLRDLLFGTVDKGSLQAFKEYHARSPTIFEEFKKYAHMMKKTGRPRYSGKCIMEQIRWHRDLKYTEDSFKISNSMTSLYVRLLIWNDPSYLEFFQLKSVKGFRLVEKKDLS